MEDKTRDAIRDAIQRAKAHGMDSFFTDDLEAILSEPEPVKVYARTVDARSTWRVYEGLTHAGAAEKHARWMRTGDNPVEHTVRIETSDSNAIGSPVFTHDVTFRLAAEVRSFRKDGEEPKKQVGDTRLVWCRYDAATDQFHPVDNKGDFK